MDTKDLESVSRAMETLQKEVENDRKRTRVALDEITRGVNFLHALVIKLTNDVTACKNELDALRKDARFQLPDHLPFRYTLSLWA